MNPTDACRMNSCLNLLLQAGKLGRGGEKGRCQIQEVFFKFIPCLSDIMDSEVSKLFPSCSALVAHCCGDGKES